MPHDIKQTTVDFLPCPITKQLMFTKLADIDVPPVEQYTRLGPEQAAHARRPALDVRDYPQHDLDDVQDPDIRERKRQENVATTLRMIDDALKYSK